MKVILIAIVLVGAVRVKIATASRNALRKDRDSGKRTALGI
jgi:hypothetical protein